MASYLSCQLCDDSVVLGMRINYNMIDIPSMYRQSHKLFAHGIEGYEVKGKYEEIKEKKQREISSAQPTKRQNFLDEYTKVHGSIPGPGAYLKEKEIGKKKRRSQSTAKKMTYIDEIIQKERKNKTPAPGDYKVQSDLQDRAEQNRRHNKKSTVHVDRVTYLDAVQYTASVTPGVGSYNPQSRPQSATIKPKRVDEKSLKRISRAVSSRNKAPDMGSYNPVQLQRKQFSKRSKSGVEWGKVQRFKDDKKGANLGPGKYRCEQSHISRKNVKSVYYH